MNDTTVGCGVANEPKATKRQRRAGERAPVEKGPSLAGSYYEAAVLEGILAGVKEASTLKGVGVATASALLSVVDPRVPFMSDELLLEMRGKTDYTVAAYSQLLEKVGEAMDGLWKGRWDGGLVCCDG